MHVNDIGRTTWNYLGSLSLALLDFSIVVLSVEPRNISENRI